jgi:cytochrome c
MNTLARSLTVLSAIFLSGTAFANEELAKSKGCLGCHAVDHTVVGPSYKDVAAKYAGQPDVVPKLVEKVMKGGGGTWGQMPMPPNPQVSADETSKLVQWVLGLK